MPLQLLFLLLPLFLLTKVQCKTVRKQVKPLPRVTILYKNKLSAYFYAEVVIKGASAALKVTSDLCSQGSNTVSLI